LPNIRFHRRIESWLVRLNFAAKSKLSDYGKLFLKDLIGARGASGMETSDDPIAVATGRVA
jgi:hypothetical protein